MYKLKVQITFRVLSVLTKESYGFDKKFAESIEPGDIIMVQSDWDSCFGWGSTGKNHEVIITNKGMSKKFSSNKYLRYLPNRILEYEQLDIL